MDVISSSLQSVVRYMLGRQLLLFDAGELSNRPRQKRQPESAYEARKTRLDRMMAAARRQRLINFDAKPRKRRAKMLSHWAWECPADLVDIIAPEIGAMLQKQIYERAAMVRERMKPVRFAKANCYPVNPIVLDRLSPLEMGIDLRIKDRFE